MLASQATNAMLAGQGAQGAQLAGRLRGEMEKLFSECNSKGGEMSNELDQSLSLSHGMNPGNSFQQMMQNRKFGGKPGNGFGMGASGPGGASGYAVQMGPNANVLGNETAISNSSSQPGAKGLTQAKSEPPSAGVALDKPHTAHGVNAVNRESGAVQGEAGIEQYSDLVEKYFKAITK
ncbi:MAG: hypothetical protein EOP84_14345 [Verrucomicrobiaceae bacterium]|nr:MAG: hypothetical protein EOP84_14345 [Verrucomicrobiaceae bacterium]